MRVRIDLHVHSTVSDGTESPAAVVRRARAEGLDVMALTDHDSAAGWSEGAAAAAAVGLGFVPGMEISTRHGGRGVHLLGYLFDPSYPLLADELAAVLRGREGRLAAMLERLVAAGAPVTEEQVRAHAGPYGVLGRPHIADALVAEGLATDRADAFVRWLNPGRPGYETRYAPSTSDLIRLVNAAGGAAVIAHPWSRGSRRVLDAETLARLADDGLAGLEVDHQSHSDDQRAELRAIGRDLGLVITGSSDHHGQGKVDHDLGVNVTAPDQFERLLAIAADHAAESGRVVPRPTPPRAAGTLG